MKTTVDLTCELGSCSMTLPQEWNVLQQGAQQLVVIERARDVGQPGFRANVVLTIADNGALGFRDWQAGTDELLPRQLTDYQLIDLERCLVAGHPGGRRLAQHVVAGPTPVTMEQWFTQVGSTGYTLTATVDSWRYDLVAEDLADFAHSLVIHPVPEGGSR